MRLRNYTLPVASGSALIILSIAILIIMGKAGLICNKDDFTKIISYDRYLYPYLSAFNTVKTTEAIVFSNTTLVIIFPSIIALALGALEFNNRNVE